MSRLSRLLRPFAIIVAFLIWAVLFIASCTMFVLNRRLSRELLSHNWREPTLLISAAGNSPKLISSLYGVDWRVTPPVTLDSVPAYVPNAFIAAEDVRFHHHVGIDPIGMARALWTDLRAHGIAQGGSTIDQQIVKARFLSQERTWRRKFIEILLALMLDARMKKDEILEIYLNDIYLGHSGGKPVLGVDEAARLYFDKSPRELRLDEAALLAGMIRAPNRDTPEKRPDVIRARRDAILEVMRKHDWITDDQYREATSHDVEFNNGTIPRAPFPFYLRALRAEVVKQVGIERVIEGGLKIYCEMDPDAQAAAERAASRGPLALESRFPWIRAEAKNDLLNVAILSVDPRSGGVRALVGGSNYDVSPFDRTSAMRRQPGSAFKTFAYLPAIAAKKATPSSLLLDAPLTVDVNGTPWEPHNYDTRFRGRVTVRQAFEQSLNVPTVRLTQDVGLRRVVDTAENFGFEEKFARIPALPLGVTEVSVWEMTTAYTAFPNLGVMVEPYLVREVRDRRSKRLYRHELQDKKVADPAPTYVMHSLLRGVVQRGTASRLKRYGLSYVAGKTGTTSDYRDAWFVGYVPDMVTTLWVGFDRGSPLRLSSGEAAIPIWGAYMSAIPHVHGEPKAPAGVVFRDIDPESGMLWQDGCPGPWREVFLSGTEPTVHCPRGFFGNIARRLLFDREHFDEPPAITFEQFRKWAGEVERERQDVQRGWGRLRKIFGGD